MQQPELPLNAFPVPPDDARDQPAVKLLKREIEEDRHGRIRGCGGEQSMNHEWRLCKRQAS
jgi:hypothetical protein